MRKKRVDERIKISQKAASVEKKAVSDTSRKVRAIRKINEEKRSLLFEGKKRFCSDKGVVRGGGGSFHSK